MIFNTGWFLVFIAVFLGLFWTVPSARLRFGFVLLASAVFHFHFAGPAGVLPIIVLACVTYAAGLGIAALPPGGRARRWLYLAGLAVPVGALVLYKYRGLLLGTLAPNAPEPAASWLNAHAGDVPLPLALSFFTFEYVHYLTDVFHGSAPIRRPTRFAFFSIFFPSIVSGPIKRFQPFLSQVETGIARPAAEDVVLGTAQVALGFFKKLVVADSAAILVDLVEKLPAPSRGSVVLLGVLLSIRILFDFSGYSDIAIGLARMMGLTLPKNFQFPYAASSLAEFWQRWHMSLSLWIRDYVYIPLGGNRHGPARKVLNLSVTMFLCGLWHGPAWHFGLWGLYHGLGLAVHDAWQRSRWGTSWRRFPVSRPAGILLTDLYVGFGWFLFFYPLDEVARLSRALVGVSST